MLESNKNINNFLEKIELDDTHASLIAKSSSFIKPGDVLSFSYKYFKYGAAITDYVNVLVVSVSRGAGLFFSTKNNLLISCYKLDSMSASVLKIILNAIYIDGEGDKQTIARYKVIEKSLGAIIGSDSFRTYKMISTGPITKINFQKGRLRKRKSKNLENVKMQLEDEKLEAEWEDNTYW